MHQGDRQQNRQCDHGSSLTVGLQAAHNILTGLIDRVSTAGQTEVMFESHQSVSIQNMLLSASDLLR